MQNEFEAWVENLQVALGNAYFTLYQDKVSESHVTELDEESRTATFVCTTRQGRVFQLKLDIKDWPDE